MGGPTDRNSSSAATSRAPWFVVSIACLLAISGVFTVLLVRNWPFTEQAVNKTLRDRFNRQVLIGKFHKTYFPPGCIAENVSFQHRKRRDLPPLITVQRLIIRGSYAGLLMPQKRVPQIEVVGLHVTVPPKHPDGTSPVMPLTDGKSKNTVGIDQIKTDGAVLDFISKQPGKGPFTLRVHQLTLDHVAENGAISFHAALLNTEPPGEIVASGQFGPWDSEEPGRTPVSGVYTFDHANLAAFKGLSGALSSKGSFGGALSHINTDGTLDVPNFHVDGSSHTTHLSTLFHAEVDAENGDTSLQGVQSQVDRTTILSNGEVTGQNGQNGKVVALDMSVSAGRVEDLLLFFTEAKHPSITGDMRFHAKVRVPPGPGFLKKISLSGDFGISNGRFTNPDTQAPINHLSESSKGQNEKQEDPRTVLSGLKGHVDVQEGIARLTGISFTLPGTFAEMRGTYDLLSQAVDIQGVLHTNGKLSDATSGFKAIVLKVVTPFMKKNHVTIVPFTIKGTSSNPSFALDFDGKRTM